MPRQKEPGSLRDYLATYKEFTGVLVWIRREIVDKRSLPRIRWMVALSIIVVLCNSIAQAVIGLVFSGLSTHDSRLVFGGVLGTAAFLFLQRFLDRCKAKHREWIMGIHFENMDRKMLQLFFNKGAGQHIQENLLSVSSINKGRENLYGLLSLVFFETIPTASTLVISLLLLFYLSMVAGALMLLCIIGYLGCSLYLNYYVMKECNPLDREWRRIRRRQSDRMEKATRVIVSAQEDREVVENMEDFSKNMEKDRNFWIWFIGESRWRNHINVGFYSLTLAYGSYLVWRGAWQIGLLYPLFSWSRSIIDNIWTLAETEQKASWYLPAIKHMIRALSAPTNVPDPLEPVALDLSKALPVVFENVSFSYTLETDPQSDPEHEDYDCDEDDADAVGEDRELHTLRNVSLTIGAGEKVAMLGGSGAGKTTSMRLAMRFMDPSSGSITVGGVDLREITKASWMKCIGHISQHPEVFDGTIRDNITYHLSAEERSAVSDNELWELMKRLKIDFGKRLDRGLQTRVGKHGLKLSGGQAQRLMIGAAVIGNPWFMVIDEATSSLDSTTEKEVQRGLAEILSGNTSALIVAHRLSTVRHLCTKFVVLRPASDVREGESQVEAIASSFEELYRISPTFRRLADDQEIRIESEVEEFA